MKKVKGFTLIELIVVIAIIGVLAAILVPSMMGWVVKSRITTNNSNASEICTQLQSLLTDRDTIGNPILENGTIVYKNHSFSGVGVTLTDSDKTALQQINDSLKDMSKVTWAAKVSDGCVVAVSLSGNDCKAVGGFPVQCPSGYDFRQHGGDIEDYLIYADANASSTWPRN